jgi:hypothetical protein
MYPCILFALHREAAPFYRHFPGRRRLAAAPCPAWQCGPCLVLETGVGAEASLRALRWLVGSGAEVPGLVSAGFAGALDETYRVGDVIEASEVVDEEGGRWPTAGARSGRVLTTTRLVGEPSEKRRLGERFGAAAVDMESAHVVRFCAERAIPFCCVRAISDAVDTRLSPRLVDLLSGPRVRLGRLLAGLVRSPGMVGELWRLARDTGTAARALAGVLSRLVRAGAGWCGPRSGCAPRSWPR